MGMGIKRERERGKEGGGRPIYKVCDGKRERESEGESEGRRRGERYDGEKDIDRKIEGKIGGVSKLGWYWYCVG